MSLFRKGKLKIDEAILADLERYLARNLQIEPQIESKIEPKIESQIEPEEDEIEILCCDMTPPSPSPIKTDGDERPKWAGRAYAEFSRDEEADCMAMPMAKLSVAYECAPCASMSQRSLEDVVGNLEKSFMELVYDFADAKGMTDLEVRKKAEIDKRTFSKLKCGTTKAPSKNTALALAIALELNLDETKDLLARAGIAISPCCKSDMIVQYFIEREAYDIAIINDALYMHGEEPLGSVS